jgi:hypothetical protein
MDKTALVEIDMEGGERLLRALDEMGLDVHAALWFYLSDPDEWRFIVSLPLVDQEGHRKAYTVIQSELKKLTPPPRISLKSISAVGLDHHLIQPLRMAAHMYPDVMNGKWFTRTVINNVFIEAAYIYRLK